MTGWLARRAGLGALFGGMVPLLAQAQPGAMEKVVYHLNLPGGENFSYFRQVLVNARNHVAELPAGRFAFRVVMHARGLDLLRLAARQDPQIAAEIDNLKQAGVRFEICRTTMRLNNIRLDELYDAEEADIVPSGVAQVGRLQHQGFAYIKI